MCHLGGGCSVTAVLAGASVDTTMGVQPTRGNSDMAAQEELVIAAAVVELVAA